jgi:superfamily I DNA/RNA helicase
MTTEIFKLETNYRCCHAVARAAENLIKAGGGDMRVIPRPDAPEGKVEVTSHIDFDAEVKYIASKIHELDCSNSCAVLVRNNALAAEYTKALEGRGFPLAKREQAEVPQDWPVVRAFLAALQQPDNDLLSEAFIAALKGQEQAEASRRAAISKQCSINESSLHFPQLETAHSAVGYIAATKPSAESLTRLKEAAALLDEDATVSDLLIALADPPKAVTATPGVVLSTVHSAKGMEFRVVFLPAFEEGCFPSNRKDMNEAEERRVAYVAITRAESNLFISWCRTRQEKFGRYETLDRQPSRFLKEAGLA